MDEKVRQRQALFELREKTLGQILDETVARIPDKEAIVYADRNYRQTWREFADTVDLFAKGLMALGVQKGEKVAVPSRKYGEEVGAFIIARPDVPVAPEDVRAFCRGKIAWYKIPRYIAVVDGFPLTASGKIQKFKLREMAAERWPEAMAEPDSKTAK